MWGECCKRNDCYFVLLRGELCIMNKRFRMLEKECVLLYDKVKGYVEVEFCKKEYFEIFYGVIVSKGSI